MKQQRVNWKFLIGLIETDGSFQLNLSAGSANIKPVVKISQKTNKNVLGLLQNFLALQGINSTVDPGGKTGRADSLRIQGKNQVTKLLALLEQEAPFKVNGKPVLFASAKQRDFLILKECCNNSNLSVAEKIDLLKSQRKTSQVEADIILTSMKTRRQYEEEYGLPANASVNAAASILNKIDKAYKEAVDNFEKGMASKTLVVPGDYLTGLIDGDGGYYVTYQFQEPTPRYNKRNIAWQGNLTLTMETNALLTLKVFMYAFGISTTIEQAKAKTSYQIKVRKQGDIRVIMKHHEQYPLIGDYRQVQLDLVKKLYSLRDQGLMRDYSVVESFLKEVYQVSEISSKGPQRRSLEKVLEKVKSWLLDAE
jgi:hypothetical protein